MKTILKLYNWGYAIFELDKFFWSANEALQWEDPLWEVDYTMYDGPCDHPNSRCIWVLPEECKIRDIWEEEDVEEVGRELERERDEEEEE